MTLLRTITTPLVVSLLTAGSAYGAALDLATRQNNFDGCLQAAQVQTLVASDPGYASASLAYNRRLQYSPAAIVYPESTQEVAAVVQCASASHINVVARSGGHSYAAYGLGGQDGSLVVDLSKMTSIALDNATGYVTSQTGNRLGNLAQYLWDNGQRALPHGTCPYVGTGGHASYGGFGMYSRVGGLLLDRVVSAEVVTANGTVVNASATNEPELFWALRGAAPSYGIVTAWTFKTDAAPPSVIVWNINFNSLNEDQAIQILVAYQSFANSHPPNELSVLLPIGWNSGGPSFEFDGTYYGSQSDFEAAIKPLTDAFTGIQYNVQANPTDWYGSLIAFAGQNNLDTSAPDTPDNFYAKSIVISQPFSQANLSNWVNFMSTTGASSDLSWWVQLDMYGGAISNVAENATAYTHRSDIINFQFYGSAEGQSFPSDGTQFMDDLVSSLTPNPTGAYPNYIDPDLTAQQWQSLYYDDKLPHLKQLKAAWDPTNVFNFPQSIPLQ